MLAQPVPVRPRAGKPHRPNISAALATTFSPTPARAMTVTGHGFESPSANERSAANHSAGNSPHTMARR